MSTETLAASDIVSDIRVTLDDLQRCIEAGDLRAACGHARLIESAADSLWSVIAEAEALEVLRAGSLS